MMNTKSFQIKKNLIEEAEGYPDKIIRVGY